jgi:uncharacterized delta-60 repeat protein
VAGSASLPPAAAFAQERDAAGAAGSSKTLAVCRNFLRRGVFPIEPPVMQKEYAMRTLPLLLLVFAVHAFAGAAGPLSDPSWNASPNGIARIAFDVGGTKSDYASAAALNDAGELILGGDVAIAGDSGFGGTNDYSRIGFARMLGNGSDDAGFAHYLLMAYPQSNNGVIVTDLAAVPGGGAIFIGQSYNDRTRSPTVIGRLTDAGALDTTFNLLGYRLISGTALTGDLQAETAPQRLRIQPDGKVLGIIAAGTTAPVNYCAGVVRLTTTGALDSDFGGGTGTVCYAPATPSPFAAGSDLALLADGSILLAGEATHIGGSGFDMAVARLDPGGVLDTTFGTDGWAFVGFDQGGSLADVAITLAIDASGRILLAGFFENVSGTYTTGLTRLLADGSPDSSFGTQGKVILHFDLDGDQVDDQAGALDVHLLAGGRILVGGNTTPGNRTGGYALAAMLRTDGSLDPDFGTGGLFVQANPATPDIDAIQATRVLMRGDYLYFSGNSNATDNADFAAMRLIVPLFGSGFE